ncbi:MAG: energy transducer TonB [Spirochaetaceae bacterium]|jgi:protein TonB|nr:energy transducer TonB [Spirochaetaceae bacterium]
MMKDNAKDKLRRGGVLVFTAALHVILLFFIIFTVEVTAGTVELPSSVMKLADIGEEEPPPDPLPPPHSEQPPAPAVEQPAGDPVAETVIEAEESSAEVPAASVASASSAAPSRYTGEYLPQNMVSVVPRLDEKEIRSRLIYPPIALRASLEGLVYLELYIDREGFVRRIRVLKETPPGRGFGEAAVKAFEGLRGKPAMANGEAVAVRYRYPVRFQISR